MPAARQHQAKHQPDPHPQPATAGAGGEDERRSARKDHVVKAILHSIFSREVVGGDRLVEEELAMKLGVSRTPVREALRELTGIGVILLKPNHGAMVRPFGATQLLEIYQVRRLLESEATRLACKWIDRDALRQLRDDMHAQLANAPRGAAWSARALALDSQLHVTIAHSSGSERLAEEIHRYWTLARSIAEAVRNSSFTQERAIHEHGEIIDRLLANQPDAAAKAMSRHLELRAQAALEALCPPSGRDALRALLEQAADLKAQQAPSPV